MGLDKLTFPLKTALPSKRDSARQGLWHNGSWLGGNVECHPLFPTIFCNKISGIGKHCGINQEIKEKIRRDLTTAAPETGVWGSMTSGKPEPPLDPARCAHVHYSCTCHKGDLLMATEMTYTQARATFASLCKRATSSREPIIIHRRNAEDVALVSVEELESLTETAHLLRSPKNAERLISALHRALKRKGHITTVDKLRKDVGLS
jgi:antitoxin YefM